VLVWDKQLKKAISSSKFNEDDSCKEIQKTTRMKDKKQEPQVSGSGPTQSPAGPRRAERIRSSRFEWDAKSGEPDHVGGEANAAQRSLLASFAGWLTKLFSGSRDFFDKDDDATPSAA
jgi:hypothetical protein